MDARAANGLDHDQQHRKHNGTLLRAQRQQVAVRDQRDAEAGAKGRREMQPESKEDEERRQDIGPPDDAGHGLDVHRVYREEGGCPGGRDGGGAQGRQERQEEQGCPRVQRDVDHVERGRMPTAHRPRHGVADRGHRPIRGTLARHVGQIRRQQQLGDVAEVANALVLCDGRHVVEREGVPQRRQVD